MGCACVNELDTHIRKSTQTHVLLNMEVRGKDGLGYKSPGTFHPFLSEPTFSHWPGTPPSRLDEQLPILQASPVSISRPTIAIAS